MKVTAFGPFSTRWPDGSWFSPIPNQVVQVDDADTERVAFLRRLAASGKVRIEEDPTAAEEEPSTVEETPTGGETPSTPAAVKKTTRQRATKAERT